MIFDQHINKAIILAKGSKVKRARVSALAFSASGRLIASTSNKIIMGDRKRLTIHAEEMLIKKLIKLKAIDRFRKINILVLRFTNYGISMAKPCKECRANIERLSPNIRVFYSNWDSKFSRLYKKY